MGRAMLQSGAVAADVVRVQEHGPHTLQMVVEVRRRGLPVSADTIGAYTVRCNESGAELSYRPKGHGNGGKGGKGAVAAAALPDGALVGAPVAPPPVAVESAAPVPLPAASTAGEAAASVAPPAASMPCEPAAPLAPHAAPMDVELPGLHSPDEPAALPIAEPFG
jgi:hypothetical protein